MPWYRTGTVSVTLNSNAVIGTGTAFVANSRVGDAFLGPDGGWYEVTNIASDSAMSIAPNYRGATNAAGVYALTPVQGYTKDLADQARAMIQQWGATLAGLGTVSTENIVPIAKGGTGATTEASARNALGLKSAAVADVVGIVVNGAILEAGTNANGSYTKFADGTLICTNSSLITATVAPGSSVGPTVTPAHAFAGAPIVDSFLSFYAAGQASQIYSSKQGYGQSGLFINTGVSASASLPSFTTLGNNTAYSYEFRFIAIGRWK
ncbi:phage tail protein [Pseudomonas veronii]|nr:phage tail protein [Pseudomonas veronii]RTY64297.1 phage tail protein [Pseudomonas veronii]